MTAPRAVAAAALVILCGAASTALASDSADRTPMLGTLVRSFASVRDYSLKIAAHEADGRKTDDRILRFWMRKPDRAKMEVEQGLGAGLRIIWTGGTRVRVRGGILSLLPITLDLHDPKITSLRGNSMLQADFGATLACFVAHRDHVSETPLPESGGSLVAVVLRTSAAARCGEGTMADRSVTRDVLIVRRADAVVVRRERYAGDDLVERWVLSDQRLNAGLGDEVFR